MNMKLSQELGQRIISYLVTKPYVEVFEMIEAIKACEIIIEAEDKEKKDQPEEKKVEDINKEI